MQINLTPDNLVKQSTLYEIEKLCTQEEMPECAASCPLHVESREFLAKCAKGDWAGAFSLYAKRITFPHLMSYICEAPCEKKCKRSGLGGAIKIRQIEQFAVNNANKNVKVPPFFPKSKGSVAVVGGGLRGMTCAVELCKKGFDVTIFEKNDHLGGKLNDINSLPKEVLKETIDYLNKFPIKIKYNCDITINSLKDAEDFLLESKAQLLHIAYNNDLFIQADKWTGRLGDSFILTGTRIANRQNDFITKLYDGKTIALTVERMLTNVSISAGREKEGPFQTTLFSDLDGVEYATGKEIITSQQDAIDEASRCIQCECLKCVKACKFMQDNKSYPKRYAREVFNNLSIAMGIHTSNKLIGTCNLCGQCGEICPNGFPMKELFLAARERMVITKKMPPSYHEFALRDMEYSNGDNFFLALNQNGYDSSKYVYFPSCQLAASEPDLLMQSYVDLTKRLDDGVGLMLGCCGIMAYWAGQTEVFNKTADKIKSQLEIMGNPIIITSCPSCKNTFEQLYGCEVKGIWEIYSNIELDSAANKKTLKIHDACGARTDLQSQTQIRDVLKKLGHEIVEPDLTKEYTPCCGYGGLTPFVSASQADSVAKFRAEQLEDSVTYCVNCRDMFLKSDTVSYHFLELIFTDTKTKHKYPTWSERQFNRKYIKNKLLNELWEIETMQQKPLNLIINDELKKIIDDRMILVSDIEDTIKNAKIDNSFLKDLNTGYLIASFATQNVTYWVVFEENDDGFVIHNAYSHRMQIVK